ncbi:hypothetical protein EV363DRAFT_1298371 [Boletus edulis]|nr:hypothetical protein EV363DRAFT_1298371 [Boletus edulis]
MTTVCEARESDEAVLARLGYRQEFKRNFKPLDYHRTVAIDSLCAFEHSIQWRSCVNVGLWVMFHYVHWMALGKLASSAPTSGGLYYLTYTLSSPRSRNVLCWIVGSLAQDASTISGIAGIASVGWGCTVQIAAGANIGSDGQLIISNQQCYGIYAAIVLSQAVVCSLGTKVLAPHITISYMTGTPVNTVWFDCVLALLIGLLALLGRATINAVFMISVTATYMEYITPIVSRHDHDALYAGRVGRSDVARDGMETGCPPDQVSCTVSAVEYEDALRTRDIIDSR